MNKEKSITMCYGQCFLDKSLDLADDAASDDGTAPSGKQRIDFPVFFVVENGYSFCAISPFDRANSGYLPGTSSEHYPAPFHPPAIVS